MMLSLMMMMVMVMVMVITYLVSVPLVLAVLVLLDFLPTLLDQSPSPKSFVQRRLGHGRAVVAVIELILMNGKIAPPFM